jgi:hypothetical protein
VDVASFWKKLWYGISPLDGTLLDLGTFVGHAYGQPANTYLALPLELSARTGPALAACR